jgi:carboxyl-terminal processing protease
MNVSFKGASLLFSFVFVLAFLLSGARVSADSLKVTLAAAGRSPQSQSESSEDRYKNLELFQKVLHYVETHYVDQVTNTHLIHGAIQGMMETLDPHSNFLPPEIFKEMKIDTTGQFGGIGIEIGMKDDVLTVIAPIEETPAWKAGIKAGDRIVRINGESTKGMNLSKAVARMRGKIGEGVSITIFRSGSDELVDVSVIREKVEINPVKSELLEPQYGYVRLRSFSENATVELEKAIKNLEKDEKLKGLIFDMRGTPGGLLEEAVGVTSLFIQEGAVVSTIGRNREEKEVRQVRIGKNVRTDFPLTILVDSNSASAAEIVAGALQDHNRAVIMGRPTFGKGSVQQMIEVGQGSGVKLTIARFYTPKGRSIQERGIEPDILLDEYDPELLAQARIERQVLRERDLHGHLLGEPQQDFTAEELRALGTGAPVKVSAKAKEIKGHEKEEVRDAQIQEALKYLKSFEIFKRLATPDKAA